jgi:threonine/homoserine/homoserine lactone efflux protein
MDLSTFIAFVVASTVFIAIPGPNVALICSQSLAYGLRYGLLTVAGVGAGAALQLVLVVLGLGALIAFLSTWFEWLRWLGVMYLLYLGIKSWKAPPDADVVRPDALRRAVLGRSLLISLTNAHTLLFFGAFLPQFIDPRDDAVPQLAILAVTYSLIALALDALWAVLAAHMRKVVVMSSTLRNRLTGGLLVASAAGLALARRTTA